MWLDKKQHLALLRLVYHKFLAKNFKLLHKCGFFEKLRPVLANKKLDNANITESDIGFGCLGSKAYNPVTNIKVNF